MHVFEILFNDPQAQGVDFRSTELYRVCVDSGIIPRSEEDLLQIQDVPEKRQGSAPLPEGGPREFEAGLAKELVLHVDGMWCTACSWLMEEVLRKSPGIVKVQVFFLSDLARIAYLPHRIQPRDILADIEKLGYTARPAGEDRPPMMEERKNHLLPLGVSAILTANIMMLSFVLYFGFFQDLGEGAIGYLSYPLWLLATPVVFYGGYPILKRAFLGLRHMSVSMDTLIAVGSLSAYFYSLGGLVTGSLHLYFDTAAMLITIVLLGRYIELRARDTLSQGITELYSLSRGKVRLCLEKIEKWVASEAVEVGDSFRVSGGERIPLDALVLAGQGEVDASFLTGESRPMKKSPGETVMGGTLLLGGELHLQALRTGSESAIGQMIALMQEALSARNSFEVLADRLTRFFVPIVLLLAAGTAGWGWMVGGLPSHETLLRAVTVLVITCPCALGIATPLAKVAAIGAGRSRGILIRDPSALERARDLDVLICDKTGTLTEGVFSLQKIVTRGMPEHKALARVASIETGAGHFLAREILRRTRELSLQLEEATRLEYFEGLGARGCIRGTPTAVGNRAFMKREGLTCPRDMDDAARKLESDGNTVLFFGWEGEVQGYLAFGDSIKAGAAESLRQMQQRGLTVHLVSGDSQETTQAVAQRLGVEHFRGQSLPVDKVEIVRRLQQEGHRVAMMGDGVNDAAALARADVGIALGTGSNILQEASDITLMTGHPEKLLEVLDLSHMTVRIIRQNLFFALFYNVLGIPLAVAGMLNPIMAVAAMFASSLTVIGNTLRISRKHHGRRTV